MAEAYITLQFVCGRGLASRTIAWFSQGHLSHVDYVMDDWKLLGARNDWHGSIQPGVRIRPPSYLPANEHKELMRVPCTAEQKKLYEAFLKDQLGKPYDQLGIFAFMVNRNWRDESAWFCSELQTAAGEKAGIFKNKLYLGANKVTPVMCAMAYSAIGGKVA